MVIQFVIIVLNYWMTGKSSNYASQLFTKYVAKNMSIPLRLVKCKSWL